MSIDYAGLRRAIRDFVRGGVEHGVIRVQQYTGTLEDDLAAAAYSVAREDPAGAYAVDYMTHECTLIVSYYEIHVDITFRKTLTPLSQIPYVSVLSDLERRLHEAMDGYDAVLTIYAGYDQEPDYARWRRIIMSRTSADSWRCRRSRSRATRKAASRALSS